jgi:hypothetical protein
MFDFTNINDKNGKEDKGEIYEKLSKNTNVEFKLFP